MFRPHSCPARSSVVRALCLVVAVAVLGTACGCKGQSSDHPTASGSQATAPAAGTTSAAAKPAGGTAATDHPTKARSTPATAPISVKEAGLDAVCMLAPEPEAEALSHVTRGKPLPGFTVTDIRTGKPLSPGDYKDRFLLVHYWASWCPNCRTTAEHSMAPLYEQVVKRPGSKLAILAVGVNFNDDSRESQRSFMDSKGYAWPAGFDESGKIAEAAGVVGVPTAVVLDPTGKVVTYGFYKGDWAKRLDEFLRQACVTSVK